MINFFMSKFLFFRGSIINSSEPINEEQNLFYNITKLPDHGTTKRWSFRFQNDLFIFNLTSNIQHNNLIIENVLLSSLTAVNNVSDNDLVNHITQSFLNYGETMIRRL